MFKCNKWILEMFSLTKAHLEMAFLWNLIFLQNEHLKPKKRMFFVQHDHYKHGLPWLIKLFFIPFCFFLMFMCEKYIGNDINILSSWNLKFKSQKFEFWGNIQVRKTVQYIYIIKLFAHTYIYIYVSCFMQSSVCWLLISILYMLAIAQNQKLERKFFLVFFQIFKGS